MADLLNKLSIEDQTSFVENVLLTDTETRDRWRAYVSDSPSKFRWETQYSIKGGIIDIVLLVGDRPAVVVENKVGATFRRHLLEAGDERAVMADVEQADANQMHTYGRWLSERSGGFPWGGALIILTHFSRPPDDYQTSNYGVGYAGVCRWRSVWLWAQTTSSNAHLPETSAVSVLLSELADFLESEGMSSEYATSQDLVTAQIYARSANRLDQTFGLVEERLGNLKHSMGASTSKIYAPTYHSDGPVFWAWIYFKGPSKIRDNWHIAWGIMFPDDATDWWAGCKPTLPRVPYVFVSALSEEREPHLPVGKLDNEDIPAGWSSDPKESELITGRPCYMLRQNAEGWAEDFADFVVSECERIKPVMLKMERLL